MRSRARITEPNIVRSVPTHAAGLSRVTAMVLQVKRCQRWHQFFNLRGDESDSVRVSSGVGQAYYDNSGKHQYQSGCDLHSLLPLKNYGLGHWGRFGTHSMT